MRIKIMRPRSDFPLGDEGYKQFRSQKIKYVEACNNDINMMEDAKAEQIKEFMNGGSHKVSSVSQVNINKTVRRI